MVLDTSLLNTQQYKVRIEGKVEQSPPPLHLGVVTIEKGTFGSSSTTIVNFTYLHLNCVLMVDWIAWNRTVFDIETILMVNWIVWNSTVLTLKLYLR